MLKEECLTAFPAMIRPVQLLRTNAPGRPPAGKAPFHFSLRALVTYAGQTSRNVNCLTFSGPAQHYINENEFTRAIYAANVIVSTIPSDSRESGLSFRLNRGTVGGACGCCHYDVFRRPIGTGRPFDQSIANDDPSRETQGPSMAPGPLDRTVSPAKWSLVHEALVTKRARRRDPRSNRRRQMHKSNRSRGCASCRRHDSRPLWPRKLGEDKLV
jgi:hypothetical protein